MKQWFDRGRLSALRHPKTGYGLLLVALLLVFVTVIASSAAHAASRTAATAKPLHYVAIGDSVAAGTGLPPATDATAIDTSCGRSAQAYPNLLATKLGTTVTNYSCSGATVTKGLTSEQPNTGNISQLQHAFADGTPDLLTITIGANDVRWVQILMKCYVGTCGTATDTAVTAGYLTAFQAKLAYTLHEIKDLSGTNKPPKVLITGYYNPIGSRTSCLGGAVTATEAAWVAKQTNNLNKAISQVVSATTKASSLFKSIYNFAIYVPVSFSGHELCSSKPWVQGINDIDPIHPNAAGAAAIASTLARYTNN